MRADCPECGGKDASCAVCGSAEGPIDIGTGAPKKEPRAKRAPQAKAPRPPREPRSRRRTSSEQPLSDAVQAGAVIVLILALAIMLAVGSQR